MGNNLFGKRVKLQLKSGKILNGRIKEEPDWLVGCPVFVSDDGEMYGVGYDGDVVLTNGEGDGQ